MKVKIEKIEKVKTFEPFNCVITFESPEEVRLILQSIEKLDENLLNIPSFLFTMQDKIRTELRDQGFTP